MESGIWECEIIVDYDRYRWIEAVNRRLNSGWRMHGTPFVAEEQYHQVVIRYVDDPYEDRLRQGKEVPNENKAVDTDAK